MLKSGRRLLANVGFVGLGQMGSRMAPHLWRTAGHTVTVFDMSPAAVAAATATGAKASTSVAQACTNADFVFLMLPDGPAVRAVTAAAQGRHVRRRGDVVARTIAKGRWHAAKLALERRLVRRHIPAAHAPILRCGPGKWHHGASRSNRGAKR